MKDGRFCHFFFVIFLISNFSLFSVYKGGFRKGIFHGIGTLTKKTSEKYSGVCDREGEREVFVSERIQ